MSAPIVFSAADCLERQFAFVRELDRLKAVLRATSLIDRSRHENSAEHSWHLATMAPGLWPVVLDAVARAAAAGYVRDDDGR